MSADGGERRGHTVVCYQSGQHVNRALALIYTRWDRESFGHVQNFGRVPPATSKRQEDGVERYEDGMNTL